jgi:hypothetical protein
MKTEHVTLIAASLAAVVSISGVLFSQLGSLNLERDKWVRSQADAHRGLVVDLGREIANAHQHAELLVWRGMHAKHHLEWKEFQEYDTVAKSALGKIFQYRIQLVSKEPNVFPFLDSLVNAYYRGDECISFAAVTFRDNPEKGGDQLAACYEKVNQVSTDMDGAFAAAMNALQ